ncbi:MAG TPA: Calx-beta domain-containing protein [Pseudonocardiaceae bacterium]
MRPVIRLFTMAAAAALGVLALVPAAQAAPAPVFTVGDTSTYEYRKDCSTQGPPYACTTTAQTMYFQIWTPSTVRNRVTFGYQIEVGTATPGVDFTGPLTGTAVMAANTNWAYISVPLVMDGVAEPSETLRVRLTSSSTAGDISDPGNGTILNDGQIPADCTLSRPTLNVTSLSCTDRPATQNWYFGITCREGGWGYVTARGATVTGNGTSTAECAFVDYEYGYPYFHLQP